MKKMQTAETDKKHVLYLSYYGRIKRSTNESRKTLLNDKLAIAEESSHLQMNTSSSQFSELSSVYLAVWFILVDFYYIFLNRHF